MKSVKQDFSGFQKLEMTTSVRFCLSYDPLKWDFVTFKMNIMSVRKCTIVSCAVHDVTCTHQNVMTYGQLIFLIQHYPLNKSDII